MPDMPLSDMLFSESEHAPNKEHFNSSTWDMLLSDMKADKPKQEDNDKAMHHMQNVGRLPTGRCSPDEHHAAAAAGTI